MRRQVRSRQKDILVRGVYEDNLRMVGRKNTVSPLSYQKKKKHLLYTILAVVGMFALIGGTRFFQQNQTSESIAQTTALMPQAGPSEPTPKTPEALPIQRIDNKNATPSNLYDLYGLDTKVIAIDPGHGGEDPGAMGPTNLMEKTIALDIALRLKRRLENYGYRILMTREEDTQVSLRERVDFVRDEQADLLISIHINALPVDSVSSIETYYFSPRGTPEIERLALLENRGSGYSVAEWDGVIQKLGSATKIQESKKLASSIQTALYRNIRQVRDDVADWGVRSGPFMVLRGVNVPAVLAELAVINNEHDEAMLSSSEYRKRLALSLEEGIRSYLENIPNPSTNKSTSTYALENSEAPVQ